MILILLPLFYVNVHEMYLRFNTFFFFLPLPHKVRLHLHMFIYDFNFVSSFSSLRSLQDGFRLSFMSGDINLQRKEMREDVDKKK